MLSRIFPLLILVSTLGCQSKPVAPLPPIEATSLYGAMSPAKTTAPTIIVSQWHPLAGFSSKQDRRPPPQAENQIAIYYQLSAWIDEGHLQTVIAEGCEGEIDDSFEDAFNGWTLKELKDLPPGKLDTLITHVGLKMKAKYGDKVRVVCGDDSSLVVKHMLVLSDLRGLSSFAVRISQLGNEPAKRDEYLKQLRTVLKLPETAGENDVYEKLMASLRAKMGEFEELVNERNEVFVKTIKKAPGRSAVVVGAIHVPGIESKLRSEKIDFATYQPTGLRAEDRDLLEKLKELLK